MTPRCLGCDTPLADPGAAFDGGCVACVGAVWAEVLAMGDLSDAQRFVLVGMFHVVGAETHAQIATRVPFTPFDGTNMRDHE